MGTWFGTNSGETIKCASTNDYAYAYGGNDYIYCYDGNDRAYGGYGNDRVYGDYGNDYVYGDYGNDYVYGDYGSDYCYGGSGGDKIYGGHDKDYLYGGGGSDYFYFGKGDTSSVYLGRSDTVYDFGYEDQIYLKGQYDYAGNTNSPGDGEYGLWQYGDYSVCTYNPSGGGNDYHDIAILGADPRAGVDFTFF